MDRIKAVGMTRCLAVVMTVISLFLLNLLVVQVAEAKPPVEWSPKALGVSVETGTSKAFMVSVASRVDLEQVSFRVGPKLAPYASVQPSAIAYLKRGEITQLTVTVSIPVGTPIGPLHGVIRIQGIKLKKGVRVQDEWDDDEIDPQERDKKNHRAHMVRKPLPVSILVENPTPPTLSDLTFYTNPAFPLMMGYRLPNGNNVSVYGLRDAAGTPLSVDNFTFTTPGGQEISVFFDENQRLVKSVSKDGAVINFLWSSPTQVVISGITPDGSAQANITVDLNAEPVTNSNTGIVDLTTTDASAKAVLSSILKPTSPRNNIGTKQLQTQLKVTQLALAAPVTNTITTHVSQCGAPTDATVNVRVSQAPNLALLHWSPTSRIATGTYTTPFTNVSNPIPPGSVAALCQPVMSKIQGVCNFVGAPDPITAEQLLIGGCGSIAAAVALITPNPQQIDLAFKACMGAVSLLNFCPSANSAACDAVGKAVDMAFIGGVAIEATAKKPGCGPGGCFAQTSKGVSASETSVDVNINVNLPNNGAIADDVFTIPSNPSPLQNYVVTGTMSCLASDASIQLFISGTDNYTQTMTCPAGEFSCSAVVPGGAAGVTDTITMTAGSTSRGTFFQF